MLRTSVNDPGALLIADTKVAPADVPGTTTTADQIKGYIARFQAETKYSSAVLAIATNDKKAADEWVDALKDWVAAAGLAGHFSASRHDDKTWFIIGGVDRPVANGPSKSSTARATTSKRRGQSP